MDETRRMLEEEIQRQLEDLEACASLEESAERVETLSKVYKLKIEEDKLQNEIETRKNEEASREEEKLEQRKNGKLRFGLEVGGLVLPLIFYGVWMYAGFRFEEKGSITSHVFKSLTNKFKPTK